MNQSLLNGRRAEVIAKIDAHIAALNNDLAIAQGGASLQAACLGPLTTLRERAQKQESLAHITQAESEALKEFDAVGRIESAVIESKEAQKRQLGRVYEATAVVRKQRIIKPTEIKESGVSRNS